MGCIWRAFFVPTSKHLPLEPMLGVFLHRVRAAGYPDFIPILFH
jgi:hypothetical protein